VRALGRMAFRITLILAVGYAEVRSGASIGSAKMVHSGGFKLRWGRFVQRTVLLRCGSFAGDDETAVGV
jgi:hypothetical protein